MLGSNNPLFGLKQPIAIDKNPVLQPSEDFYFLRRKGIEFIEQMASAEWTDYNTHDPGITILEALCYAITELGFQIGKDIKELLAEPNTSDSQPERQAFFSAREILSINPLTIDDYRRLLIDQDLVANAWLIAKNCHCETRLYADCKQDSLSYLDPPTQDKTIEIITRGMYDVLLELDHDPVLGDLNDNKAKDSVILNVDGKNFALSTELRFPAWESTQFGQPSDFYDAESQDWTRAIATVELQFGLFKLGQEGNLTPEEALRRWRQWHRVFFAQIKITFVPLSSEVAKVVELEDVPLKLFGVSDLSQTFKDLWDFDDINPAFFKGLVELYIKKVATVQLALHRVRLELNSYRNLAEDICNIALVCLEDVAVCADIDLRPDADIERALANVLFEIERYFNPGLKFFSLQELLAEAMPVDEIFDGPKLSHGFIKQDDLVASELKRQLRLSDLINRLVEIDGILAIKNLLLTRFDQSGQAVTGVADANQGKDKISASWTLEISERCLPKLYVDNSKFIFFKNGLPFIPRTSEVQDTLNELRGQDERIKIRNLSVEELDLPVPTASYRPTGAYYPVQYSLPMTYGVGFEGVRRPATERRLAQAKQLQGYLLVFEQILANAFAQIANVKNVFSLDPAQTRSYFVQNLRDENVIRGVTELIKPTLGVPQLQALAESEPERLDRRNRVLDHLMSRFAESFSEYAMLLHSVDSKLQPVSQSVLIGQKIAFLKSYPLISTDRYKSFNYLEPLAATNQAVIRKRIALLLGLNPQQERTILIIEHLLLRPKFYGDALMEVCLDQHCNECDSRADPYSFQMTIVMPGWLEPFRSDIELRRFADRTIKQEVPSHLLAKTCWVDNLKVGEGWEEKLLDPLRELLREKGKNAGGQPPTEANATLGAIKLRAAAFPIFTQWLDAGNPLGLNEAQIQSAIKSELQTKLPNLATIYGGVKNYGEIGDAIYTLLADHFTEITLSDQWLQFEHFRTAWIDWLAANAKFNWQDERVQAKVEAVLAGSTNQPNADLIRARACQVLTLFGTQFAQEMKANVMANKNFPTDEAKANEVKRIVDLALPDSVLTDIGLTPADKDALSALFSAIYPAYFEVTTALWRLVMRLAKLHSIYPPATLHDCDEGNDDNPVRLGSTMLGG